MVSFNIFSYGGFKLLLSAGVSTPAFYFCISHSRPVFSLVIIDHGEPAAAPVNLFQSAGHEFQGNPYVVNQIIFLSGHFNESFFSNSSLRLRETLMDDPSLMIK